MNKRKKKNLYTTFDKNKIYKIVSIILHYIFSNIFIFITKKQIY